MEAVEDIEVVASACNSSQHVFTPQVKNEFVPKIGQHFDNLDDVHSFYNNYGREGGFGTRLNSSKKSKDGEIIRKEYVCYKEGVRKLKINKTAHTVRKRGLTREGCGARLVVVKDRSDAGGFVVRQFVEGHNHPLTTPRKVHLLHLLQRKRGIENLEGSHASVEDVEEQLGSVNMPFPLESQHSLKEPFPVRTKGCGKRLKGGKEKAVKKKKNGRRCNGCGLLNQTHDKRNCPKLLGIKSKNVRLNDDDEDGDEEEEEDEDIDLESD